MPKFAAVNGTWVGEVPDCLQGLTLTEEILVGLYFMRGVVLTLGGRGPPSSRQRGFTGHVISLPLHTASTRAALLPRPTSILSESVSVTYFSKVEDKEGFKSKFAKSLRQLVYIRKALRLSRNG